MDEIDHVRSLRADTAVDEAALARVRARVGSGRRAVPPPARARRRWVAAGGLVAAAAAAAVVAGSLPALDGTPVGTRPAAASVLEQASNRAEQLPSVRVRGDQYVYTRTRQYSVGETDTRNGDRYVSYGVETVGDSWIPVDGERPGRTVSVGTPKYTFFEPGDEAAVRRAGGLGGQPGEAIDLPPSEGASLAQPTPAFLAALPTDPRQLYDRIAALTAGQGNSREEAVMEGIAGVFRSADAFLPSALRAALFDALALVPGIERVTGQADIAGRVGIAMGRVEPTRGIRWDIIVDPATAQVLGDRQVLIGPPTTSGPDGEAAPMDLPAGTVLGWSSTDSAVVDTLGSRTPAG